MRPEEDNDNRTVFCGNLSEDVSDSVLYELFIQAGPVECVRRPKDQNGRPKSFAFIVYKHECSIPYAVKLFRGTRLFNRNLNINSRCSLSHMPVLNTHLTEFNECDHYYQTFEQNKDWDVNSSTNNAKGYRRRERSYDVEHIHEDERNKMHHHLNDTHPNEPKSWAELNTLRGKGSLSNDHYRGDLRGSFHKKREMDVQPPVMYDFNALLQMGQQMMMPGMTNISQGVLPSMISQAEIRPALSGNIFRSMQEMLSSGKHNSPSEDRKRSNTEERSFYRKHPYNDRPHNDHHDDHRRHERGNYSSHASHYRERRDRRNR